MTRAHEPPLVSVVTPFYNTERYLEQCIESVVGQTYENIEYILVDNCSSDDSGLIAERYASRYKHIRLIRTPTFLSQVENYNFALEQIAAESKYCKIVQADDWLFATCVAQMVETAERSNRIGVVSSYYFEGEALRAVGLPYPQWHFSGRDICRIHLIEGDFFLGSPTVVMFRSDIVRSRIPFYELNRFHEDTEVYYEILVDWDLGFAHDILSYVRVHEDSISARACTYNPRLVDKIILLKRYGRTYLNRGEYRRAWRALSTRYNLYLGESVIRRREAAFWDYHRRALATIGHRISKASLLMFAASAAFKLIRRPVDSSRRLIRFWRSRQASL